VPVTVAVPVAVPVKVTVQLPAVRRQFGALNIPVPVDVNVTVPIGTIAVPVEVSATTTLQEEPWLMTTGVAQVIVVELVRRLTVMPAATVLELAR
jgi:hypothetical protein